MNSIKLFQDNALKFPHKMAIADTTNGILSFEDIANLSSQVQGLVKKYDLTQSDSVLVAITPSPILYGTICGLMGLGIRIVFIEPWLAINKINDVIETTRPKIFLTSGLGKIWGARSKSIRNIPHWLTPSDIIKIKPEKFEVVDLKPEHHAFIVFSSGTTGKPKGVIRTHSYMQSIYDVFMSNEPKLYQNPDLIIFPNVALYHLATGRGSIIVPTKWSQSNLEKTLNLCEKFLPETLSTGPAFLKTLIDQGLLKKFNFIKRIVVGGALTDCLILENAFNILPDTSFLHIYGGSEAEPVTIMDARLAVNLSRKKGYFQTLCLGPVIPQMKYKTEEGVLWVSGPNVAGEYIGNSDDNKGIKYRDSENILWHCMGDKVIEEDGLLWFSGRQSQRSEDFNLEQRIYSYVSSSKSFLHRSGHELILIGEEINKHAGQLKTLFPQINQINESKIVRDKRHRSRIDRKKSLPQISGERMKRFFTYLNERSPLVAISFLASGIGISAMAIKEQINWPLFFIGIILNNLLFIQMRLGDELKDFETDKIINPQRPLPRGLFTTIEFHRILFHFFLTLIIAGLGISILKSLAGGSLLIAATIFSWLMFKEFYISHTLEKSPITYAITHQIIVFPLFAWVGVTFDCTLITNNVFQGWLLANFGASFTFEICRKLNPDSHVLAKTYAHHYGRPKTILITSIFILISALGAFYADFIKLSLPFLVILFLSLIIWNVKPQKYKFPAAFSALSSTVILWAPALFWVFKNWSRV